LFQQVLTINENYNRRLQKMTMSSYCLSRSYQIKENIKIMHLLRKLAYPTILFNIPAFAFISMYTFLPHEERINVVRNISVAFFDLWISLYALSFGILTYNLEPRMQESVRRFYLAAYFLNSYDDFTGRIRKLTNFSPPPQIANETDIYFNMLSKDLHNHNQLKKHSALSTISVIEI
ncbi:hypothetical protein PFISCL1PPCAC_1669, partial [Pristionchus fissidentatus]